MAQMWDNQTEGEKQISNHLEQQRRQQEQDHNTEAAKNQKSNGEVSAGTVAKEVSNNIEGKPYITHFRALENPEINSYDETNSLEGNSIHIVDELAINEGGNITLRTEAELANQNKQEKIIISTPAEIHNAHTYKNTNANMNMIEYMVNPQIEVIIIIQHEILRRTLVQ